MQRNDPPRWRMVAVQTIPRGRDLLIAGAEGATAPETLRQKDRAGHDYLESGAAVLAASTEGVSRLAGEISQVR